MILSSKRGKMLLGAGVLAMAALSFGTVRYAQGSDHADTVYTAQTRPRLDLSDLHIFPSPTNPANVVLSMSAHPLIPAGSTDYFDPNGIYQFKIDTTGDNVEDLVIQAKFSGTGAGQTVQVSGPVKPTRTGTVTQFEAVTGSGTLGSTFTTTTGMTVFTGTRADPFFIDLVQLGNILPDRLSPPGIKPAQPVDQANVPKDTSFRSVTPAAGDNRGPATDFLANLNVMGFVVELPKTALINGGDGKIRVWETTSSAN